MIAFLASFCCSRALVEVHEELAFISWMRETNNLFTGDEYAVRLGIWLANSRFVQEHNSGSTFRVGMNKFAAMLPSEYRVRLGLLGSSGGFPTSDVKRVDDLPDSFDWREKGGVMIVKDQGQCGSCWAFAAIASAEGAYFVATGTLLSLSEANMVDCVTNCWGCNGGYLSHAFDHARRLQGGKYNLEADYPYRPVASTCKFDASKGAGNISEFRAIMLASETDLATQMLQYGPIAIAIDANHKSFQAYTTGVYVESACDSSKLNHAVTCVGFGVEETDYVKKYWIVKNSWGSDWGEDGYIRMLWKNNQCGIAMGAFFSIA